MASVCGDSVVDLKTAQIIDHFNKLKLLKDCMKIIYGSILNEESFISGLTPGLKSAVRMLKPTTPQRAIELGKEQMEIIDQC